MTEPKPCPFCGGEAFPDTEPNYYGHYPHIIRCKECEARTGGDRTEPLAIDSWNRRKEPENADA